MRISTPQDHDAAPPALLDTEQCAEYLGLAVRTLQNWRVLGTSDLPFLRVGRSVKYDRREIEAWLNSRRFRSTAAADAARVAA